MTGTIIKCPSYKLFRETGIHKLALKNRQSVENTEQLEFAYQPLPGMPNPEYTVVPRMADDGVTSAKVLNRIIGAREIDQCVNSVCHTPEDRVWMPSALTETE